LKLERRNLLAPELQLLLVAVIWGFAFVAQRQSMRCVGAFFFNAVRFSLGALVLVPWMRLHLSAAETPSAIRPGILAGAVLFVATSFQTVGLATTGAGKAAFVTCLYLILVPLGSRLFGEKIRWNVWCGCLLALFGLYFLCLRGSLHVSTGDALVLIGAFFWSLQILLVGRSATRVDGVRFAFWQFLSCAFLSLVSTLLFETTTLAGAHAALLSIIYGGILSVGVAYTLQVTGQAGTTASRAAILLSLETVFATIGGWLLLGERLGLRELGGCALMFAGTTLSQLGRKPAAASSR